ncbi:type VI secretion system baseplate subunit TssF [Sorangium sp. So ce1389]|uniref:type VI secretion system baseplate subunit TssF n=1 Tax=Sorangium sp. So ce1389 TaxID=3133336 RepID=UPI003F61FC97
MPQDQLEKAFLEELAALERFRIAYSGAYPATPLSREDPDVRRLLEGMAMFSARTRLAGERAMHRSMLRIFRQHFSYLLGPVPAMGMLRAAPTLSFVDAAELPPGTEVLLVEPAAKGAEPRVFRMRTRNRLRILPIELASVNLLRVRGRGVRIVLRFTSRFSRNDEIGEVNLHINHLDDLASSIAVLHALKKHLTSASVVFDRPVREDTAGQPCEVTFGPPARPEHTIDRTEHPLKEARAAFRFPRQELYINVRGIEAPRNWREFTVCLDMDDRWPAELRLTADGLELFVVPIVNERVDMSNPITCDGTRDRYRLRHPDDAARFVPTGVLGVYQIADQGLVPMEPAVVPARLAGGDGAARARRDSYDVSYEGQGEHRRAFVALNMPGAFDSPRQVAVEAVWHQPALRGVRAGDLEVKVSDRFLAGVAWSCSGELSLPAESDMEDDQESLLELLSLKNQRFLGVDELRFLLRVIGAKAQPQFDRLVSSLARVEVSSKPFAKSTSGFKYVYQIELDGLNPSDMPRVELFCGKLLDILSAWSVEEVVELVAKVPDLGAEVRVS